MNVDAPPEVAPARRAGPPCGMAMSPEERARLAEAGRRKAKDAPPLTGEQVKQLRGALNPAKPPRPRRRESS